MSGKSAAFGAPGWCGAASMWGVAETARVSLGSKTYIASLDNVPGSKMLHSYPPHVRPLAPALSRASNFWRAAE
jgi:hypothetical protein